VASLSQGRTAAAQCGLFTHKSVPVIFEPPCIFVLCFLHKWRLKTNRYCEIRDWNYATSLNKVRSC